MTENKQFDGETFDAKLDGPRLNKHMTRVRDFMSDGRWHDLEEIARETGTSMLSVSARVRDLRKPRFGGWTVEVKRISGGLWFYRAAKPEPVAPPAPPPAPVEVKPEPAPAPVEAAPVKAKRLTRDQKWAKRTVHALMGDLFERVEAEHAAITTATIRAVAQHMMESRS